MQTLEGKFFPTYHLTAAGANLESPEWKAHLAAHKEEWDTAKIYLGEYQPPVIFATFDAMKKLADKRIQAIEKVLDTEGNLKLKEADPDHHFGERGAKSSLEDDFSGVARSYLANS